MANPLSRSRPLVNLFAIAALAVICACDNGNGYVSIRLVSAIIPNHPIYVGSTPIVGLGDRVVQQKVGTVALNNGARWGDNKSFCKLEVRKNRITIVTVKLVNGEPRCECATRAKESTQSELVCQ